MLTLEKTTPALTDISGIVLDRTANPPKIIGQAWLISKSRVVVQASCLANYAEAPWALLIKFPFPNLIFAVKSVHLHPDFDKKLAREHYLSQVHGLFPQPINFDNDIASLVLEQAISEPPADKVQELTRALALPLEISSSYLSGIMSSDEIVQIFQQVFASNNNGVLSLCDERNYAFARLLINQGRIVHAIYSGLINESAVCELIWKKPAGNFVFSPNKFNWQNIPEITTSVNQLLTEATRRAQELPQILEILGGQDARYIKSAQSPNLNKLNPPWLAERLWVALDGYLSISQLSEKTRVDTYSSLLMLAELKKLALVTQEMNNPFVSNPQLSTPLIPAYDLGLTAWDKLTAFYLDAVSLAPVSASGNYFGAINSLSPVNLLHTISLPNAKYGAIILKEGEHLVGLNTGKYLPANVTLPFPLYHMVSINALNDSSIKRLRAVSDLPRHEQDSSSFKHSDKSSLSVSTDKNYSPFDDQEPPQNNEPEILKRFSKMQILLAGSGAFLLGFIFFIISLSHATSNTSAYISAIPAGNIATTTQQKQNTSNAQAVALAVKLAGFKTTPIPPFVYVNTCNFTAPKASFALVSEQQNQHLLFVEWPNAIPEQAITTILPAIPFFNYKIMDQGKIASDSTDKITWQVSKYAVPLSPGELATGGKNKEVDVFVGVFRSILPRKSILVLAQPYTKEGFLDYQSVLNLVQRMFAEPPTNN